MDTTAIKTHQPCDDCGSSDALSVFSDGHTFCFSCEKRTPGADQPSIMVRPKDTGTKPWYPHDHFEPTRGISEDLCRRFGIHHHSAYDKRVGREVDAIVFDIKDQRGRIISQKVRVQPDGYDKRIWKHEGKPGFFGYHLMKDQKYVVVTEGEFDAASLQQILNPKINMFVCISIPQGVSSVAKFINGLKLRLRQFEKVFIAFDMDGPGRDASEKAARIIGDKAYIVKLPAKDGNDCLTQGLITETHDAFAKAEPFSPAAKETADEQKILAENPIGSYTNDDTGLADRVETKHGKQIRYCTETNNFAIWDGKRWSFEGDRYLIAWINEAIEEMSAEAEEMIANLGADSPVVKAFISWVRRCRMDGKPNHVRRKLSERLHLHIERVAEFDSNPYLLNCQNGTVDLRTGDVRPHDPADLITMIAGTNYKPNAKSDQWDAFLSSIFVDTDGNPDPELLDFVHRAIGYSSTGDVSQNALFFANGDGGNGKTTLFETLRVALGEYAAAFDTSLLTGRNASHSTNVRELEGLGGLRGRRLAVGPEVDSATVLKLSRAKQVSGADTMRAASMYGKAYDFKPTAKLWLLVNHLPAVLDQTHSAWRRMIVVPFNAKFKRGKDANTKLQDILAAHAEAVLAWVVSGAVASARMMDESDNADGLGMCDTVEQANIDYRQMFDVLGQFIEDHCVVDHKGGQYISELYSEYSNWCSSTGRHADDMNVFSMRLRERADGRWLHDRKSLNGRPRASCVLGLRLKDNDDRHVERENEKVTIAVKTKQQPSF